MILEIISEAVKNDGHAYGMVLEYLIIYKLHCDSYRSFSKKLIDHN